MGDETAFGASMIIRYAYLAILRHQLHRYLADSRRSRAIQHDALLREDPAPRDSDFGRDHGFGDDSKSVDDFRQRMPVLTYEDHQPYIARVLAGRDDGDVRARHASADVRDDVGHHRRTEAAADHGGDCFANIGLDGGFGAPVSTAITASWCTRKLYSLRAIGSSIAPPSGVPCGQISGLAAATRPKIANYVFFLPAITGRIHDPAAKHYAALRFALANRRVGMIITANPSTLVEFARRTEPAARSRWSATFTTARCRARFRQKFVPR